MLVANRKALAVEVECSSYWPTGRILTDALVKLVRVQLDTVSTDASIPGWFHLRRLCGEG